MGMEMEVGELVPQMLEYQRVKACFMHQEPVAVKSVTSFISFRVI